MTLKGKTMLRTNLDKTLTGPDGCEWRLRLDKERRLLFFQRRLGETWSPEICAGGINHILAYYDGSFNEELAPLERFEAAATPKGIRIVLHSPAAFRDPPPDHLQTPQSFVRPRGGRKGLAPEDCENYPLMATRNVNLPDLCVSEVLSVMFLDCLEVESVKNLEWFALPAEKHLNNPVLNADKLWESQGVNCVGGTVLFTDGKYRMWYNAREQPCQSFTPSDGKLAENWQKFCNVCLAESDDGLHWQKPELGLVEYMGNKKNNLIPSLWRCPTIIEDVSETDPQRRFKCSQQFELDTFVPELIRLHTSSDGIIWKTVAGKRSFRDSVRPHYFVWTSLLIDTDEPDPEKRWKAYGYFGTSPTRRTCGAAWSRDGITWTCAAGNPVIPPRLFGHRFIHDLVVWKENGLYLGLVQVGEKKGEYDYALVFSRDGIHFNPVGEDLFLARGTPDEWDGGNLHAGCCMPLRKDGKTNFYYCGNDAQGTTFSIGLAYTKYGRYAGFRMVPGKEQGVLCSRPITLNRNACRLILNAETADVDTVTCALLDPVSNQARPGYEHAACNMQVEGDATTVSWKDSTDLPAGRFRLEIRVRDPKTKLFGFHIRRQDSGKRYHA